MWVVATCSVHDSDPVSSMASIFGVASSSGSEAPNPDGGQGSADISGGTRPSPRRKSRPRTPHQGVASILVHGVSPATSCVRRTKVLQQHAAHYMVNVAEVGLVGPKSIDTAGCVWEKKKKA